MTGSDSRQHRDIAVRPAAITDSSAISRLSLLTADNGKSAATRMYYRDLPGLTTLLPFLYLPTGFSYVLVETTRINSLSVSKVIGCVCGTSNPSQFSRELQPSWWPMLKEQYSKSLPGTPLDRHFINSIHRLARPGSFSSFATASLHIRVLPTYKDLGCEKLLINVAMRHFKKHVRLTRGSNSLATT